MYEPEYLQIVFNDPVFEVFQESKSSFAQFSYVISYSDWPDTYNFSFNMLRNFKNIIAYLNKGYFYNNS